MNTKAFERYGHNRTTASRSHTSAWQWEYRRSPHAIGSQKAKGNNQEENEIQVWTRIKILWV